MVIHVVFPNIYLYHIVTPIGLFGIGLDGKRDDKLLI